MSGPALTVREKEVARLVAEGLTNREIATRLVISERTAEGHVEQIRNKLGFRARAQVAAWAMAEGLVRDESKERASATAYHAAPAAATPWVGLLPPAAPLVPVAPLSGQIICPVLIGRARELDQVSTELDAVVQGSGRALLVTSEAGVGKSAFAREAVVMARARGMNALLGSTFDSDRDLPYAPFVSALRSGFRASPIERLRGVLTKVAPDLAQLFPELGARPAMADDDIERHRVVLAFEQLFTAFAREAPLLLVVEDLHWADEASLGALLQLARGEVRRERLMILATYRSDELRRRHPLTRAIGTLERERLASRIVLGPLSAEQTRELVYEALATKDATELAISDAFRDTIYAHAEGNPFFTEELLKGLADAGDLVQIKGRGWQRTRAIPDLFIPPTIRDSVRDRIERLSPEAQASLAAAAVAGQRFDFDLLRAVRGIDDVSLERQLKELVEHQLVLEADQTGETYAFRHALTREVVYEDLLVRERKRLHRTVAESLLAKATTDAGLLAHHLLAAGDQAGALPHLLGAARQALRAEAPREAAAHLERAVEIGLPELQLAGAIELLAEAYQRFDVLKASKAAQEALALYRERGDHFGASRLLRLLSRAHWIAGREMSSKALASEAVSVLDGLPETVELGRALVNAAHISVYPARFSDDAVLRTARAMVERALEIGQRFDDGWTVANALVTRARLADRPERQAMLRALEYADRHGFSDAAVRAYINLIEISAAYQAQPDLPVARRYFEEGRAYARRHGIEDPLLTWEGQFLLFEAGDWDEIESLDSVFERLIGATPMHAREPGRRVPRLGAAFVPASVTLARAGPDAARQGIERAVQIASETYEDETRARTPWLAMLAYLRAATGDLVAARPLLDELRGSSEILPSAVTWLAGVAPLMRDDSLVRRAMVAYDEKWALLPLGRALSALKALLESDPVLAASKATAIVSPVEVVLVARFAAYLGLTLGAEWSELFERARTFSQRVRALWVLEQLGQLDTEIAAP